MLSKGYKHLAGRGRSMRSSVTTLMIGSALGQAIPLLAAPILTRLFSPEQFGVFSLYLAMTSVFTSLMSGRYELAVMLPERLEEAANLAAATLILSALAAVIVMVLAWVANDWLPQVFHLPEIAHWIYFVPLTALSMVAVQVSSYWLNRHEAYRAIAAGDIVVRAGVEGARVLGGLVTLPTNGLILGQLVGQLVGAATFFWLAYLVKPWKLLSLNPSTMWSLLKQYRRFPLYTLPYGFIAALGTEAIPAILTSAGLLAAVGHFTLARRMVIGPIGLFSASFGRIFYREAALGLGTDRLHKLVTDLMTMLVKVFTPTFIFFVWWAPNIFEVIFGLQWKEAGIYAAILSPTAYMYLFTSWPERIFEVASKQHISLIIQIVADVSRVVALLVLTSIGSGAQLSISVYSALTVVYHIAYLAGVFYIGGFTSAFARSLATRALITSLLSLLPLFICNRLAGTHLGEFLMGAALFALYIVWLGRSLTGPRAV